MCCLACFSFLMSFWLYWFLIMYKTLYLKIISKKGLRPSGLTSEFLSEITSNWFQDWDLKLSLNPCEDLRLWFILTSGVQILGTQTKVRRFLQGSPELLSLAFSSYPINFLQAFKNLFAFQLLSQELTDATWKETLHAYASV